MVVDALVERLPAWADEAGAKSDTAVFTVGTLVRNLADYAFPPHCSVDERRGVEERVVSAIESVGALSGGRYFSLVDLDPIEIRFLAERRLITANMIGGLPGAGVYVSEDQSVCVFVNGGNHLAIRVLASGWTADDVWGRIAPIDSALGSALDFAFDERLGFLTADLAHVGTGLQVGVMLALPALSRIGDLAAMQSPNGVSVLGVGHGVDGHGAGLGPDAPASNQSLMSDLGGSLRSDLRETLGSLYFVVNAGTLGVSEDEVLFNVRHAAGDFIEQEQSARVRAASDHPWETEDLVGRARGLASGARLLDFGESLDLLASMRLGLTSGEDSAPEATALNALTLAGQGAHIEIAGGAADAMAVNYRRAERFRQRFNH